MPNAGMPRAIEGRNIYLCSPEYMASFGRKYLKAGVQFIGGCCGTTPNHIRAMRSSFRATDAQKVSVQGPATRPSSAKLSPRPWQTAPTSASLVSRGEFVTMVEIVPPRGISCTKEIEGARLLASLGVHAINVPDSPRASARMSAQSLCIQIQQHTGIETILHYTCRDRNVLSIQSDLLGASSIGLKNILCLTGDPPKLGNYPDATAVFDVDAIGLVNIVRRLNYGLDIGGNPIGESTGFTIGVAANPGVPDLDNEVRRFAFKVEAGAEYAITQPVFDLRLLEEFLRRIEGFRIPVIAGIWPLTSLRNAEFMKNDLRVSMPDEIMTRMAQRRHSRRSPPRRHSHRAGNAGRGPTHGGRHAGQRTLWPLYRRCGSHRRRAAVHPNPNLHNIQQVDEETALATFEESLKKLGIDRRSTRTRRPPSRRIHQALRRRRQPLQRLQKRIGDRRRKSAAPPQAKRRQHESRTLPQHQQIISVPTAQIFFRENDP